MQPHDPETTHVCLVDLERSMDVDILAFAAQHGHVIVTRDSDFHDLAVLRGAPPQVIRLRLANCRNDLVARLLIDQRDALCKRLQDPMIALIELG